MENLYDYLTVNNIEILDLCLTLIISSILGFIVTKTRTSFNKDLFDNSLASSFFLLAPIISLIMVFIGSSLALSIGLVGSLSIIRFRSVIKNTKDMVYLLWVISIGLGCGSYKWSITILATLLLAIIQLISYKFSKKTKDEFNLILKVSGNLQSIVSLKDFQNLLIEKFPTLEISFFSFEQNNYSLEFRSQKQIPQEIYDIIESKKKVYNITEISIFSNENPVL